MLVLVQVNGQGSDNLDLDEGLTILKQDQGLLPQEKADVLENVTTAKLGGDEEGQQQEHERRKRSPEDRKRKDRKNKPLRKGNKN